MDNVEKFKKDYKRSDLKLARLRCRKNFLEDCKHFNLIPKFLMIKNKIILREYRHEVRKFEGRLLCKASRRVFAEINIQEKYRDQLWDYQLREKLKDEKLNIFEKKNEIL